MKAYPLAIFSALFFSLVNSNLDACQCQQIEEVEEQGGALKRTCCFSEKNPLDQALYGTKGDFLENVFADAASDFGGRGYQGHWKDKREMLELLKSEQERLKGRVLYRGREMSPEYHAAMYALLLQFRD